MKYLKIKDNVDLKELKKSEFSETATSRYEYIIYHSSIEVNHDRSIDVSVDYGDEYVDYEILIKLYDLIQAGLVEKVVE